jgi:hypothetical protein
MIYAIACQMLAIACDTHLLMTTPLSAQSDGSLLITTVAVLIQFVVIISLHQLIVHVFTFIPAVL